jgi:GAF domain-containing protein
MANADLDALSYAEYKELVQARGEAILEIMAAIATANLKDVVVDIPPGDDILGDIAIGLSYIVEDFRNLLESQARARQLLEETVAIRTAELEKALKEIQATQRRYIHDEWQTYTAVAEEDEEDASVAVAKSEVPPLLRPLVQKAVAQETLVKQAAEQMAVAIPIHYADEMIGVLGLTSDTDVAWADDDLTAVVAIAEQVGLALENQRLFDQTQAALAQTEIQATRLSQLNDLGTDLQTAPDLHSILTLAGRYMHQIFSDIYTSVALQGEDGQRLDIYALKPAGEAEFVATSYDLDQTALGIAMRTQLTQRLDYDPDSDFLDIRDFSREGYHAFLNAPLTTRGRVIGTINVRSTHRHAFDLNDENLLQQMAALIASNIESRQLLAEAQRQAQRERLVNDITQKIQSAVTVESALQVAIQELGQALRARYTQVTMNNE